MASATVEGLQKVQLIETEQEVRAGLPTLEEQVARALMKSGWRARAGADQP